MQPAIEAGNLTKTFKGGVTAVSALELQVPRGVVYGLIGRNGAGKTTTIRLLLGLLRPDQGTARILGHDLWEAPHSVRARVAYVPQAPALPGWMSLSELTRYAGHFYERWESVRARDLARHWDLAWNQPVGTMSGGEQRRAAILMALAPDPDVLMLDEPTLGLDPIARREVVDALISRLALGDGCTVFLSTQIISDLERIVEYVGIMDRGRITTAARLDHLQQTMRRVQVIFPEAMPPSDFMVPGALRTQISGPVVTAIAQVANDKQLDRVRRLPGVRVQVFPLGLEELFIELFSQQVEGWSACDAAISEAKANHDFRSGRHSAYANEETHE
jgi:ABC-2 type transport system ATP-binding protein